MSKSLVSRQVCSAMRSALEILSMLLCYDSSRYRLDSGLADNWRNEKFANHDNSDHHSGAICNADSTSLALIPS